MLLSKVRKEKEEMRKGVLVVVLILALSVGVFAFQNEPDGFRGLKWGDPPGKDMKIYGFGRDFDITIYTRRNDKMQIGDAELRSIYYVFYEGRFMAVEISPYHWPDDYLSLRDVVMLKFGDAAVIEGGRLVERITWSGDLAVIVFYLFEESVAGGNGDLTIYSTEIWEEKEEEFSMKKEEAERKEKEEKRKAAEEGSDDF